MMPDLNSVISLFHKAMEVNPQMQVNFFISIFAVFVLWIVEKIILKIISKQITDSRSLYHWRKTIGFSTFVIGIFVVGRIWFAGLHSIATFLGLLAAGLAVALKDPIVNLAGWGFILGRSLFKVGDRIQIGKSNGDVIDINIFYFTILEVGNWVHADQSTGRMIQIPNGFVFHKELANYTKGFGFIWNEIPVTITFESDWEKAKKILNDIVYKRADSVVKRAKNEILRAAKQFLISYSYVTPTVYTTVTDSGVMLTIRYLCRPRQRRNSEQEIWEDILKEFSLHNDIDFAYPTQRFYKTEPEQIKPKQQNKEKNNEKF